MKRSVYSNFHQALMIVLLLIGPIDLAIFIKDISRGSTYPVGTFRQPGLQPGENIAAYTSTDRRVNDPGSYQVHVEIQPFQFEDNNSQNNVFIWAFTVK
jgi:hypothetical protein